MANKIVFFCKECGYESSKWIGKCPSCNSWNSFVEEKVVSKKESSHFRTSEKAEVKKLDDIKIEDTLRIDTGYEELNRVLGSGLVGGSMVLIGGEPGIGKSTLIMQICNNLGKHGTVLYVSGEESESQVKLRADRLKVKNDNILFVNETSITEIENMTERYNPKFCIIDSIQTMYDENIPSGSGSVSQVKEVTARLMYLAKRKGITTIIVGHVTKDGTIAGPRVLEHMVDTVIYIEGERFFENRIVRTVKNRFGSTNEIGIFKMIDIGLEEVENMSDIFLDKNSGNLPGTAIAASTEGNSTILLEIQALTSTSYYNMPRRLANGIDNNKLNIILAVLEKRCNINLGSSDVYVNIIGGMKVDEPAIDLAVLASIVSSYKEIDMPNDIVFIGEVGLTGEVRPVNNIDKRVKEVAKLGYKKIYIPYRQKNNLKEEFNNIDIIPIKNVKNLTEILLRL